MPCVELSGLRKTYGSVVALDGIDLAVEEGHILGIVGPNGAGKSTALHALLGLVACEGSVRVLGKDPRRERNRLMREVSFITDVAVLPRWIRVGQLLDYVAGVHPRFGRAKAEGFLARGGIRSTDRVRRLSKGTVTQLHLAVVMAIDAKLLVPDEPTLGLEMLGDVRRPTLGDLFVAAMEGGSRRMEGARWALPRVPRRIARSKPRRRPVREWLA